MNENGEKETTATPPQDAQEAFGGDRQAMAPLVALLIYGDVDALTEFQGECDNITDRLRTIRDDETGKKVEIQSIAVNLEGIKIDRPKLEKFLEVQLRNLREGKRQGTSDHLPLRRFQETLKECATPLYERLHAGSLKARGIALDEQIRSSIPEAEWRTLKLDFLSIAAVEKSGIKYTGVEISDPAYLTVLRGSRRGPKTRVEGALTTVLNKRLKEFPAGTTNRAICEAVRRDVEQLSGRTYKIRYLETKIKIIMNNIK